jgi:predicted nucleic acid-binding protein
MTLVVDSSVVLAWIYDDERTDDLDRILRRVEDTGAWVPGIWRLEIANSLQQNIRRKRIDRTYRDRSVMDLLRLPFNVDRETHDNAWTRTLVLADELGLTSYDACYLELAERRGLPLATLDRELQRAATNIGVAHLPA